MTARALIGGLVVLFVAMLVPAGLAADRPDDRAGPIGVGSVTLPEAVQFAAYGTADTVVARIAAGLDAYGNQVAAVRPDDLADRFTPGTAAQVRALPDDRADRFTPGAEAQPVAVATEDTGIDWNDPLVIGVLTVLVAGLASVAVFAVVHRHGGGPGMRGTAGTPTPSH